MKDIYRELLTRSLRDTIDEVRDVEEEFGIQFGDVGPMAIQLYQFRVMSYERKRAEAESEQMYPSNDRRYSQ